MDNQNHCTSIKQVRLIVNAHRLKQQTSKALFYIRTKKTGEREKNNNNNKKLTCRSLFVLQAFIRYQLVLSLHYFKTLGTILFL